MWRMTDAPPGVKALASMERDEVCGWSASGADDSGVRLHFSDGTYADFSADEIAEAAETWSRP